MRKLDFRRDQKKDSTKMIDTTHRWNTEEYEKRVRDLFRVDLNKLYPSEAWALYRVLPHCKTVVDLGCGTGSMSAVVRQIAPDCKYEGVDHQPRLMEEAKDLFPFASFNYDDLMPFIEQHDSVDCVMSWSVIKSFANWRELTAAIVDKSRYYSIFDIRVANTDIEAFDLDVCWAEYGGRRGPITYLNYTTFRNHLVSLNSDIARIEFVAYQSQWGKYVHLREDLNPETFLVTCVVTKKGAPTCEDNEELVVYEQLPSNLQR